MEDTGLEPAPKADAELNSDSDNKQSDFDALPDWAKEQIRNLRKENGNHRTKNKTLSDELEAKKLAEMTELERERETAKKLAEQLDAVNTRFKKQAVLAKAAQKNAHNPEVVAKLVDFDSVDFESDESVDAAIDAILKDNPFLIKTETKPTAPATRPSTPEKNLGNVTKADILSGKVDMESLPSDLFMRIMSGK